MTERPIMICAWPYSSEKLHLLGSAEPTLRNALKEAVDSVHGMNLKEECEYDQYGFMYELKVDGIPWLAHDFQWRVNGCRLIFNSIRQMYGQNYQLCASGNLQGTVDSLFFIRHPPTSAKLEFCMITLEGRNVLRLIDCPEDVIQTTRLAIQHYWGRMKSEDELKIAWQFKMKGSPWLATGDENWRSRYFLCNLFHQFLKRGWGVLASLNLSHQPDDKALFILQSCDPIDSPDFCISMNDRDKMLLIDAPEDIVQLIKRTIMGN